MSDLLPQQNNFITEITSKWSGVWNYIYKNDELTQKYKEGYFYSFLYNLTAQQIIALNHNNSIKLFIENLTSLKDLVGEDNDKMKTIIDELNITFHNLSESITNTPLFAYIYQNKHFVLNKLMIEQIVYTRLSSKDEIEQDLYSKHLTTIRKFDKDKKLLEVIENNMDIYIESIFLKLENNTQEEQNTLVWLLNNKNINEDQKELIIKGQKTIIEDIIQIDNTEFYEQLFKYKKIKVSWENIGVYYNLTSTLNDTLKSYLNNLDIATELSKTRINSKYLETNENFKTQLLKEILLWNDCDMEVYNLYIKANGYWYEDLDLCEVGDDKIDALIDGGKLQFTAQNLDSLIQCSMHKHIVFIEKYFSDFIENYELVETLFKEKDFIKLLESESLNCEEKFILLDKLNIESFDIDENIAMLLSELYSNKKQCMTFELLDIVISKLPKNEKLSTLLLQLEYNEFSFEQIKELLSYLSYTYTRLCLKIGSYETLSNTKLNLKLVKMLKQQKCISSFSVKEKSIRVNRFKT